MQYLSIHTGSSDCLSPIRRVGAGGRPNGQRRQPMRQQLWARSGEYTRRGRRLGRRRMVAVLACAATTVALSAAPAPAQADPQPWPPPAQVSTAQTTEQALAQARQTGASVPVSTATTDTDTVTAHPDGSL